ncbi:Peptidase E [Bacillus sp. OV194]|nr:Peptidase E [Bacillus sp. OV194]
MLKQIIALGGGGFSMEPENPLLDQYILRQSLKKNPKICFLPTASGDAEGYIERFYQGFKKHECVPSHLSLFKPPSADLRGFVLEQDVMYVGGGNTRNLMVLWREWGLNHILREAYEKGIVLAGISAGSLCWFEEGVTDSIPGQLTQISCLGILKGSNCPHYDGEKDRRPSYHDLILKGLSEGYAADDGAALHFMNGELTKAVSSRPYAKGYKVSKISAKINEEVLPTDYLGF